MPTPRPRQKTSRKEVNAICLKLAWMLRLSSLVTPAMRERISWSERCECSKRPINGLQNRRTWERRVGAEKMGWNSVHRVHPLIDLFLFWASNVVVNSKNFLTGHCSSENAGRYSRILCMHRAYFEIKPIENVGWKFNFDTEILETLAENSALILRLGEFSALRNGKNLGKYFSSKFRCRPLVKSGPCLRL